MSLYNFIWYASRGIIGVPWTHSPFVSNKTLQCPVERGNIFWWVQSPRSQKLLKFVKKTRFLVFLNYMFKYNVIYQTYYEKGQWDEENTFQYWVRSQAHSSYRKTEIFCRIFVCVCSFEPFVQLLPNLGMPQYMKNLSLNLRSPSQR